MKRALVYVSASTWEGLPGATIQAINEGVPAVVTNCKGGISAVTQNGELAYLAEVCSEEDLAGKLKKANENVLANTFSLAFFNLPAKSSSLQTSAK